MRMADLQHIPELANIPVLDQHDPRAAAIITPEQSLKFAEADSVIRARELLCRDEYQVIAAVRFLTDDVEYVRIYFARIHDDEFPDVTPLPRQPREPPASGPG